MPESTPACGMDQGAIKTRLASAVIPSADVGVELRSRMYALLAAHYDGVDGRTFDKELGEKDSVVTLWDDDLLCGFSTLCSFLFRHQGRDVAVLFSGDTIVNREHWGQQELASAWLREVGRLSREYAGLEFYWLLIVKGHRTYRYMPAFGYEYVPDWRRPDGGDDGLRKLRDALARHRYGDQFDASTGVIRFRRPTSRLKAEIAMPSEREAKRPDVAYFIRRNPGYLRGDELVCLCSLAPENIRPFGRRLYEQGRRL